MQSHTDDYLYVEEEFEPIEGCNCIYCRMARMEKSMKELENMIEQLTLFLEIGQQGQMKKGKGQS